ncbi:hypothetical protein SAMN05660226_00635 [Parapedobacter luteus]|uniref:Uncharacterized protein n=1 Tax=Parapedobacter luteus TaxID=623280 RepID=A0A1T5A6I4_9SPHI|nr:hypothetical protein SAMN05660226_00635 [Parapedobacter luteus]
MAPKVLIRSEVAPQKHKKMKQTVPYIVGIHTTRQLIVSTKIGRHENEDKPRNSSQNRHIGQR